MRTNESYSSGSRSRRGPRRRRSGSNSERKPAPKRSFWQKLVAFFKGEKNGKRVRSGYGSTPGINREARRSEDQPRRKPELVDVTSPKLYVGNLSFDATEGDLFELFKGVGNVQNAEIVSHKHTLKSKGFAFVTMQSVDEARRAVNELHDKEFMSRKLVVSGAKTSDVPATPANFE